MTMRHAIVPLLVCAACAPDFDPYNELKGPRVLSVRADQPELAPGESTTLAPLVYAPDASVTQTWSFCPWPSDPNDGFRCLVDQATWQRVWTASGLDGDAPALTLGSAPSSSLTYPGDYAAVRTLCETLTEALADSPTLPPDCTARWPWTVRLALDVDGARIDTVKDVTLLLDEALAPNQNPALASFTVDGQSATGDAPVTLRAGEDYELRVTLAEGAAETYLPQPALGEAQPPAEVERILFTWFVDQGSTEHMRTTYKEGVEPLDDAVHNTWHAPDETGDVTLYVVVRDPRGGVGSLLGKVRLE